MPGLSSFAATDCEGHVKKIWRCEISPACSGFRKLYASNGATLDVKCNLDSKDYKPFQPYNLFRQSKCVKMYVCKQFLLSAHLEQHLVGKPM
jgi:hypothetical protein